MKYFSILFIHLPVVVFGWRPTFQFGRRDGGNLQLGIEPAVQKDANGIITDYFTQALDHFTPSNPATWQQKFYINEEFYAPNSPVFLFVSGEGAADISWMTYGSWYDSAKVYRPLLVMLEHRFYGDSRPTPDMKLENLRYLSSQQAIVDLATFIGYINRRYSLPANVKWIAFGGSYSAALATWLRLEYPLLVHGVVASSPPLLAKVDFSEYFLIVANSLATYSEECRQSVKTGFAQLESYVASRDNNQLNSVNAAFGLCSPIQSSLNSNNDLAMLFHTIANGFAQIVQYNLLEKYTITNVCRIMTNQSLGFELARIAQTLKYVSDGDSKCLETSYAAEVNLLSNISYNQGMWRQWIYQTCNEFGFFQTSDDANHDFGHWFPVQFSYSVCEDSFSPAFNPAYLDRVTRNTNTLYGGKNIQVTNVVFVEGSIDPWSALGITQSSNPLSPAIFIPGTSHCANMLSQRPGDSAQLNQARSQVHQLIGRWLSQ